MAMQLATGPPVADNTLVKYFENHPALFRQHPDGSVDMADSNGNWKPAGTAGKDLLFKKLNVTGDASEVSKERIDQLRAQLGK